MKAAFLRNAWWIWIGSGPPMTSPPGPLGRPRPCPKKSGSSLSLHSSFRILNSRNLFSTPTGGSPNRPAPSDILDGRTAPVVVRKWRQPWAKAVPEFPAPGDPHVRVSLPAFPLPSMARMVRYPWNQLANLGHHAIRRQTGPMGRSDGLIAAGPPFRYGAAERRVFFPHAPSPKRGLVAHARSGPEPFTTARWSTAWRAGLVRALTWWRQIPTTGRLTGPVPECS